MYSLSTRANSVFFYFVVCLAALCAFNIITTCFKTEKPIVDTFNITKYTSLYNHPYTKVQHATGLIDMKIDFSPCFNWNSNLVFTWITATYKTGPKHFDTSVTVWDNIMLRNDTKSHKINFSKKSFEYPIVDSYKTLTSRDVVFQLHWEHMPVVGPIIKHNLIIGNFTLPDKNTQQPSKSLMSREIDYEDDS